MIIDTSYTHSPSNGPIHLSLHCNVYYQPLLSVSLQLITYHAQSSHELSFLVRTLHILTNIRTIYPICFTDRRGPEFFCLDPGGTPGLVPSSRVLVQCLADGKDLLHWLSISCRTRGKHYTYESFNPGIFIDAKRAAYGRVGQPKALYAKSTRTENLIVNEESEDDELRTDRASGEM